VVTEVQVAVAVVVAVGLEVLEQQVKVLQEELHKVVTLEAQAKVEAVAVLVL
jgi:hypothetical protein